MYIIVDLSVNPASRIQIAGYILIRVITTDRPVGYIVSSFIVRHSCSAAVNGARVVRRRGGGVTKGGVRGLAKRLCVHVCVLNVKKRI